jgi:hypothetical protein
MTCRIGGGAFVGTPVASLSSQAAHRVGELVPPLRAFAPHLVELEHAIRLIPARVVGDAAAGDERPGAIVHDAALLVLVHAEMDVVPREVDRL